MEQKILHLTLKKKWFDMIASGEKTEEYREIKTFWIIRLTNVQRQQPVEMTDVEMEIRIKDQALRFKEFDLVRFINGYGKNAPSVTAEFKGIRIGEGKPEWGGSGTTFIISLGKIINH